MDYYSNTRGIKREQRYRIVVYDILHLMWSVCEFQDGSQHRFDQLFFFSKANPLRNKIKKSTLK